jgi:hypothetical protein
MKIWAKMKIEHLMNLYDQMDPTSQAAIDLRQDIIDLSVAYGVLCKFTSFSDDDPGDPGDPPIDWPASLPVGRPGRTGTRTLQRRLFLYHPLRERTASGEDVNAEIVSMERRERKTMLTATTPKNKVLSVCISKYSFL